jgi:hypothetical protein
MMVQKIPNNVIYRMGDGNLIEHDLDDDFNLNVNARIIEEHSFKDDKSITENHLVLGRRVYDKIYELERYIIKNPKTFEVRCVASLDYYELTHLVFKTCSFFLEKHNGHLNL